MSSLLIFILAAAVAIAILLAGRYRQPMCPVCSSTKLSDGPGNLHTCMDCGVEFLSRK